MRKGTVLAIRHVDFEDLGGFAPALAEAGYSIRYLDIGRSDLSGVRATEPDVLVVLGGPIGAHEETAYPFLGKEISLLRQRLDADLPTMGIRLGAQLIARAAGATCFTLETKEIGFGDVELTEAGRESCLEAFVDDPITLHWQGDSFELPAGARHLARTARCENQAFALGRSVVGFQFHPEAGGVGFERRLVGHAVELSAAGVDVAALRAEASRHGASLDRKAHRIVLDWLAGLPDRVNGTGACFTARDPPPDRRSWSVPDRAGE